MPRARNVDVSITQEVNTAAIALTPAIKRLGRLLGKLDPATLPVGAAADLLYDLRQLGKTAAALTVPLLEVTVPATKALEDYFVDTLRVGESSGVQGMRSRIQITEDFVPTVEDWDLFYKHIKRTGDFDLLNKAVNRAAVRERWDAKKQVPGTGKFIAKKVSCTKLGGKS